MPSLKRFEFKQTGMWPNHLGEYCLVADIGLDLRQALEHRQLNVRLKKLGHVSIEALVEKLEAEKAEADKTKARIEPMKDHRKFFAVPEGQAERSFYVVRVQDNFGQLQVDAKMEIWVEFINYEPRERTTVFLDNELRITRMTHA